MTCSIEEWGALRALGDPSHIPDAIKKMCSAKTKTDARKQYWRIDNCVIVQGSLFEASYPTTVEILRQIPSASKWGKIYCLEFLVQVVSGENSLDDEIAGYDVKKMCEIEIVENINKIMKFSADCDNSCEQYLWLDFWSICASINSFSGSRREIVEMIRRIHRGALTAEIRSLAADSIAELESD